MAMAKDTGNHPEPLEEQQIENEAEVGDMNGDSENISTSVQENQDQNEQVAVDHVDEDDICEVSEGEYAALEQTIDQLDSCLDQLDQKNDDLNAKLRALLAASRQDYEELTASKQGSGGQAGTPDC